MPWNFYTHPVSPEEAIEAQARRRAGSGRPLEEIRRERELEEIPRWNTVAREVARGVGGVAVDFHSGSRAMARSPEEIVVGRGRERE